MKAEEPGLESGRNQTLRALPMEGTIPPKPSSLHARTQRVKNPAHGHVSNLGCTMKQVRSRARGKDTHREVESKKPLEQAYLSSFPSLLCPSKLLFELTLALCKCAGSCLCILVLLQT